MKKITCAALALLLVSGNAFSKAKMQFRTDLKNYDGDSTHNASYSRFEIARLRFDWKDKINEEWDYRFRFRLDKAPAKTAVETATNALDYAYMTYHCPITGMDVQMGKVFEGTGGWEGNYDGHDVYTFSVVGNSYSAYKTGVHASKTVMGQNFNLYVLNADSSTTATGNQRKMEYGASVWMDFMDSMIKPVVSYHVAPQSQVVSGTETDMLTVGVQVNFAPVQLEIDHLANMGKQLGTLKTGATLKSDLNNTSNAATLRYMGEKFRPFVKYIMDETEDEGVVTGTFAAPAKTEITSYDVALEYYPEGKNNFRYHAVYSASSKDRNVSGVAKEEDTTIRVGLKYDVDIL